MTPTREHYESLLLGEIDANQQRYILFLQKLVQAASPNPPGDTRLAADIVVDFLRNNEVEPSIVAPVDHMPNVVAKFAGGMGEGPRVVFNGHIDTFPVNDAPNWPIPPFSGLNDGKSIHGLGAVDMKAGTAASAIAFTLLNKRAACLNGSVAFTAVSDEETGGTYGTKYLLEHCGNPSPWKGDCVINGEPGGLQSVRFGEKGTLRMTFTVITEGANGAYTHRSRGAIMLASAFITSLEAKIGSIPVEIPKRLRDYLRSDKVRNVADDIMGSGAAENLLKATLNIGIIEGGVKVNVIPSKCVFEADIRLPIGLTKATVLDTIDEMLPLFDGISYKVQEAASNPSSFSDSDHPFMECIASSAESITGLRPIPLVGLGGTDCKLYRYHKIPAFVFGPSPSGMGAQGEAVLIDEYVSVIKTHTLAVFRYLWGGKV